MQVRDRSGIRGYVRAIQLAPECLPEPTTPIPPDVVDEHVRRGRAKVLMEQDNLVVDLGLSALSRMLGHGENFPGFGGFGVSSVADLRISSMRLGDGTSPPAPAVSDTDISVNPATFTTTSVTAFYPDEVTTTFAGIIPQATAALDGIGITEEGLFLANEAMFARATFSAVVKVPANAVQFEHSIQVVRV